MTETIHKQVGSYKNTHNMTIDNRAIEAQAFLNCAGRLSAAIDGQGKDKKAYGDAIRYNLHFWTVLRVAMSEPDNPLPMELKNTLFFLGKFVDRVSAEAVMKFSPDILQGLININRTIAAGLQKNPAPPATESSQQTSVSTSSPASPGPQTTFNSVMTSA